VIHELPLERRTLHGHFSRDLEPVLAIEPGDTVRFQALNAGWRWEPDREVSYKRPGELDDGHALSGPIEVRGAQAGQTLAVRTDEVGPGGWGVTFGGGAPFGWTLEGDLWRSEHGHVVPSAPFLGVIGLPPPEPGVWSTIPPRRWGGNIDCKELLAGSTLYLPIPLDGALLSLGDGHGAQGDGELSGTAIECPLASATVTVEVRDDLELQRPIARAGGAWLSFGFDDDLEFAARQAIDGMLDLMERELAVDRGYAEALASVAVDLRVTQIVNGVKGVHAILRDDAIR
jgi:acetamidase/formamidase